jgi:hypothetical protein
MKQLKSVLAIGALCLLVQLIPINTATAQEKLVLCATDLTSKCRYGFSAFKLGYPSVSKLTPATFGNWKRLIAYNFTLTELYAIAYGAGSTIPDTRVVLNVKNPKKFKSKYCYELNTPPELVDNMFAIMLKHLEDRFPEYSAHISYYNGADHVIVTDKEYGILLADRPVAASKKSKAANDTTY